MNESLLKTVFLLALLSALFLLVGYAVAGPDGAAVAFVMSLVMNAGAWWFSDRIILALHGAGELPADHAVSRIVSELASHAGLPTPKTYLVPHAAPNAFATGRDPEHSAIAVTQGILKVLNEEELRGVLAHEMSHIANRDTLVATVAAAIASSVMTIAHMAQWAGLRGSARRDGGRGLNPAALVLTVLLAPVATALIQAAVSRTREFLADESGSNLSGEPLALASALEKISDPRLLKRFQEQEGLPGMQPAFEHLYIVNHFSAESVLSWFSTHPPVTERVRRLKEMSAARGA